MELPTLAVLPYDDSLRRFPAYLQQLEMESNGKSVMLDGKPVECETAAVIWGEPGNNAQHSFFQLLHQGTPRAAFDFLLPARSSCGNQPQQNLAIASCLAQAEAFMNGQSAETVRAELQRQQAASGTGSRHSSRTRWTRAAARARSCCFSRLDPATLGRLIALYEHSVFTQSVVWGINAFDQWGVELGKKLPSSSRRRWRIRPAGTGRRLRSSSCSGPWTVGAARKGAVLWMAPDRRRSWRGDPGLVHSIGASACYMALQ